MRTYYLTGIFVGGLLCLTEPAGAEDLAVCGRSDGKGYYPSAALRAGEPSIWTDDPISDGRITLAMRQPNTFDILFSDATGAVVSATQDGASVVRVGQSDVSITVVVVYPMLVETYTFLNSTDGPEVLWTSNKHSTPIVKVGAYRAQCSFISLPN